MNVHAHVTPSGVAAGRKSILAATAGLLLVIALLIVLVTPQRADAGAAEIIKRAALKGTAAYPAVNGEAKWKAKGGQRELEVQIEDAKKLAGKRLSVRVGGKLVGYMKVNALGRARLAKSTEAGQSVPTSVTGKGVKIRTNAGVLVASGRF